MKCYPHWGSHLPTLIKVVQMTTGPILELGIGMFSTPVLHWLCYENKRELVSYEQEDWYLKLFRYFNNDYHKIIEVKDWDKIEIERPWDVVLVDHNDDRRVDEIKRLVNHVNYIIVHDTGPGPITEAHYHYSKIFPLFKYRYDTEGTRNRTTVLSNFVDLNNLR